MSRYYKRIQAGRYCMAVAYSRPTVKDGPKARSEKQFHSSKARQQLNYKSSRLQLTAIIAENFADSQTAFWVSATFDQDHYPQFAKESEYWDFCCAEGKKYAERLSYLCRKRGKAIKCVYCPGLGEGGRWHVHLVIDGCTYDDLLACWGRGEIKPKNFSADSKWITDKGWRSRKTKNVNSVAIATYMLDNAKARPLGKHPWHASRNCIRPKPQPAKVIRDDSDIDPPEGSEIISKEIVSTLYSSYTFYEYILPAQPAGRNTPKPKRRRTAKPRGKSV